ncbi:hypothetical protein F8M41_025298 [Gigaspora margarita]|uniref:Uncharacterized protein n=1 Tax=Gigaspora margarita TaxID=4874 RepID=A0A8H3XJH5_GIGMA|nr:hypothetical protein F8M41_025298 [Gigaspora margarita]
MNLTSYVLDGLRIYAFDLIASKSCARLLIMAKDIKNLQNIYYIIDPFIFSKNVDAYELLSYSKTSDVQNLFQYPIIIKDNKVIGFIGKNLIATGYMLHHLKKNIVEFIKSFYDDSKTHKTINIPEVNFINKTFKKYFVKWTLKCDRSFDILKAESENASDEKNFHPNYHILPKPFTIGAYCLDNDDLVIYGHLCIFSWTFSAKKIQMIYYWYLAPDDYSIIKSLTSNSLNLESYFLPASSDAFIIDFVFESNESPPNIQLIQIISKSLTKISERNQPFFDDFIIRTSFLWVFDDSYLEASLQQKIHLKHLSYYGNYSKLSKSTYIDSLIDKIYDSILCCKFLNNKYINLSNTIKWYNRYSYDKLIVYESPKLPLLFSLPKFVSYPDEYNPWIELLKPESSCFTEFTDFSFYQTWNGEAIINYKWNTFGKKYYIKAWTIYVVFLCSFVTVATLSDIISWVYQIILIYTTIILGFWHLLIEICQFIYSPKDYFSSSWNYLDKFSIN